MKHKKVEIPKKPDWWNHASIKPEQVIRLNWSGQHNSWWNEACADVVSVFGLPGHRFYYKPYPDYMTFTFKSTKDADLCKVLLSEKIAEHSINLNKDGNPLP
jgi:hypothetical protein